MSFKFGYFPEGSKSWIIVRENAKERAQIMDNRENAKERAQTMDNS